MGTYEAGDLADERGRAEVALFALGPGLAVSGLGTGSVLGGLEVVATEHLEVLQVIFVLVEVRHESGAFFGLCPLSEQLLLGFALVDGRCVERELIVLAACTPLVEKLLRSLLPLLRQRLLTSV